MKPRSLAGLLCAVLMLVMPPAAADEVVVVSLAPAKGVFRSAFDSFKERVETASPDTRVVLLVDGQAGSEAAMMSALRRGRAQFGVLTVVGASAAIPELTLLMAPYLFESFAEADFVLDEFVAPIASRILAEKGLVFVRWIDSGWWNIFANRAIEVPADSARLRMRAGGGDPALLFLKEIGADVIPLPFAEIVPGLQTGLIDGGATNTQMYFAVGMDEYAPHLTMTRHSMNPGIVMVNKRWYDRLPEDQRARLYESFPTSAYLRAGVRQEEIDALETLAERGRIAYEPTAEQLELWRETGRALHPALVGSLGGYASEMYAAISAGKEAFAAHMAADLP